MERARELAWLVQRDRVLLLLDGLEPLQDPPGINKGRFKDRGLAELVKTLASQNSGLLVLTTRQEIPELEGHGALVINHPLDRLSNPAGTELLIQLGVRGRQRELEQAVNSLDGHALSVELLGTYLSEICGGDIRHAEQFDFAGIVLTRAEEEELATDKTLKPAKRAAKVMEGYLRQFDKLAAEGFSGGLGGTEKALLYLVGLFDRPADGPAIEALLGTRIAGLTDDLFVDRVTTRSGWWIFKSQKIRERCLTSEERGRRIRRAKETLRKLRLLSKPNSQDPLELDAHPIVRAFFSGQLECTEFRATQAAHEILRRHYSTAAPALPETIEAMQPLFNAVQHGVKAGQAQLVYEEIFRARIAREGDEYLLTALGGIGPYLTTISYFFEEPWRAPRQDLDVTDQAWLLGMAAYLLKSLGRLKDAIEPRRTSIKIYVGLEIWDQAANLANSLSQELLLLGNIDEAIAGGRESINYCDKGVGDTIRAYCLSDYNYARAQAGESIKLHEVFEEIARLFPAASYGFTGYKQEDLLLDLADESRIRAVLERPRLSAPRLLDGAFEILIIGRAQDSLGMLDAAISFDEAVVKFRKAGAMQHLPKVLLARVAHRRRRAAAGEIELIASIREDIDEIEDIAGGDMRLYLADLALEMARLALDVPLAFASPAVSREEARSQTARAAELISDTGYHRRDPELAELHKRLANQ